MNSISKPTQQDNLRQAILRGDYPLGYQIFRENYWEPKLFNSKKLQLEKQSERIEKVMWLSFSNIGEPKNYYLYGSHGIGKTIFVQALKNWAWEFAGTRYDYYEYPQLRESYLSKPLVTMKALTGNNIIIDDFAKNLETSGKSFGNEKTFAEVLIDYRYNQWQKKRVLTQFTSNWKIENLQEVYQKRSINRLIEMFDLSPYFNRDFRTDATVKNIDEALNWFTKKTAAVVCNVDGRYKTANNFNEAKMIFRV